MRCKRRRNVRIACWCTLFFGAALLGSSPTAQAGPQWRMIPVELDGAKNTTVGDFAIGSDGTPWVALTQPQQAICYRREGQWHKLPGQFSVGDQPLFHVSPTGQVYLAQYGRGRLSSDPHFGALYRLEDMQATYITDFYRDTSTPCLFFDSRNRIWNWGNMFLARFEDGRWERVEANMGPNPQVLEDAKGNVYFSGRTLCYYRDGRLTIDAKLPSFPWEQLYLKCCLWGENKALFISCSHMGVVVVDLNTLTISDVLHGEPLPPETRRRLLTRLGATERTRLGTYRCWQWRTRTICFVTTRAMSGYWLLCHARLVTPMSKSMPQTTG